MFDHIRIFDEDGVEWTGEEKDPKAVAIEMWYDRHHKHWVLYPTDAEGNQIANATYGFGKKEAIAIKKDLELIYNV